MTALNEYGWFAGAVGSLWLTGTAFIRHDSPWSAGCFFAAIAWGALAATVFTLALLVLALPISRWILVLLPLIVWGIRLLIARRFHRCINDPANVTQVGGLYSVHPGILLLWILLVAWLAWTALSTSMRSLPGMGIWGYKAKLFFLEGCFPAALFTDLDLEFCQPSYPLALPLLATWCYVWMGHVNDHIIQLLTVLFLSLSALLLLFQTRRCGKLSLLLGLFILALFLSPEFGSAARAFYAEPMLLFFALLGLLIILENGISVAGWLLLGSCAWIKSEGLLIFLAAWLSAVASSHIGWRNPQPLAGLLFVLPWQAVLWFQGVPPFGAFAWQGMERAGLGLKTAAMTFTSLTLLHAWNFGCVWLLAPILVFIHRRRLTRDALFLLLFAILLGIASVGIFMFSTSTALEWHVDSSLNRLLIVPSCALVLFVLCLFRHTEVS